MRTTNPLREVLEAAMRRDEPMLDTEWPAGEVALTNEAPKVGPKEPSFLRPINFRPR